VDLPEPARPGIGSIGQVVRQRRPDPFGRVVVRAVAGAVQHLQPGVLLQVGGDLAGVVDAVVVADHRGHRERGNARSTWSSSVVKSAAQRRPSRYTQRPVLTSIAPNTVTCRLVPGWGSAGGRCAVSSWPARAAAGSGGSRLRRAPRPGGQFYQPGHDLGRDVVMVRSPRAVSLGRLRGSRTATGLDLASGARTLTLVIAAAHRLGRLLAPRGLLLTLHACSSSRSSLGGSTGYERSTLCVRGDVVLWVALQASLMAECLADGAGDADCGIGVSELVGASHVSEHAADGDLGLCHAGRSSCRR
jgi:hypothetical protein